MEQSTQGDNHQSSNTSKLDDEIKKISYWVGQSIMLVATVLGVFYGGPGWSSPGDHF